MLLDENGSKVLGGCRKAVLDARAEGSISIQTHHQSAFGCIRMKGTADLFGGGVGKRARANRIPKLTFWIHTLDR